MTKQDEVSAAWARVAAVENERWRYLRDRIRDGHSAAAMAFRDLHHTWRADILYDGDVEVVVTIGTPDGEEKVRIRLGDLWRFPAKGIEVRDVSSPTPRPVVYQAIGRSDSDENDTYIALVIDRRGVGLATASPEPYLDKGRRTTLGRWLEGWFQRSGVSEMNERRENTIMDLRDQYGEERGEEMVAQTRIATASLLYATAPAGYMAEWYLTRNGNPISTSPPPPDRPPFVIAEAITTALGIEAYGASRPELMTSNVGWSYDEIEHGTYVGDRDKGSAAEAEWRTNRSRAWSTQGPGVYNPPNVEPFSRAQLVSEFTLRQLGADPTGERATSGRLDHRDGLRERIEELSTHGVLNRHQATFVALRECGFAEIQIAESAGVSESAVRKTLRRARERLSQS